MRQADLGFIADLVLDVLQSHIGRKNAIKRDRLLAELQKVEPLLSDRRMRRAIEKKAPYVCMSKDGYFLAATEAELIKSVRYIDRKIHGLYVRRRAILKANLKVGPLQLELRP